MQGPSRHCCISYSIRVKWINIVKGKYSFIFFGEQKPLQWKMPIEARIMWRGCVCLDVCGCVRKWPQSYGSTTTWCFFSASSHNLRPQLLYALGLIRGHQRNVYNSGSLPSVNFTKGKERQHTSIYLYNINILWRKIVIIV